MWTTQSAPADLFEAVCRNDLEGIVAKRADARYTPEQPTWVKIKNRNYSQIEGRRKLFEKRRPAER
jgi:ATP-dependent DNA ligase